MMFDPEVTPAAPNPAMARPTMRAVEVGATAQTRLPTSKMATEVKYTGFVEKNLYALPHTDWNTPVVTRKPLPYLFYHISILLLGFTLDKPLYQATSFRL